MKKILSTIFVMIFALSFITVAFAASEKLTLDQTVSLSLENGEQATYTFTSAETAVYKLSFVIKNRSFSQCKIYSPESTDYKNAGSVSMKYSDEDESSLTPVAFVCINKGTKITFVIEETGSTNSRDLEEYDLSSTAELDMVLSKSDLGKMIPGKVYRTTSFYAGHWFIPAKSGYYNFRSFAQTEDYDPYIRIYDENGLYKQSDDSGYQDTLNYDTSVFLEAGSVYFINPRVRAWDEEAEEYTDTPDIDIDYTYSMTDASNIKVEGYLLASDYIEMSRKNYYVNAVYIIPGGAESSVNAEDITVVSSKRSVADVYNVEIKEGAVCITVYAKKTGKAVFTVDLPNGEQMSFKVKVKSAFIEFFKNIFNTISTKIKGIFKR